jgi:hypothetical protein
MRRSTLRLLRRASKLYTCVIITGPARADALRRLRGVEVCQVVGNHGAEPSPGGKAGEGKPYVANVLSKRQTFIRGENRSPTWNYFAPRARLLR